MASSKEISVEYIPRPGSFKYLKPVRIDFLQKGRIVEWEATQGNGSVSVLIRNTDTNRFILVRQFRVTVREANMNLMYPTPSRFSAAVTSGYQLEVCAGILDKQGKSPLEVAIEEVLEETGYKVASNSLQYIGKFHDGSKVGTAYCYLANVKCSDKVTEGGGLHAEGESIILEEYEREIFLSSAYSDFNEYSSSLPLQFTLLWYCAQVHQSPSKSNNTLKISCGAEKLNSCIEWVRYRSSLENPHFIFPVALKFNINGIDIIWEANKEVDSVYVLIRDADTDEFVFVRQFRASVYASKYREKYGRLEEGDLEKALLPYSEGFQLELCAGLMDKPGKSPAAHAVEEAMEEAGYKISEADLQFITCGHFPSKICTEWLYFADVSNARVGDGGGLSEEGELIVVERYPCEDFAIAVLHDMAECKITTNLHLRFSMMWYLEKLRRQRLACGGEP